MRRSLQFWVIISSWTGSAWQTLDAAEIEARYGQVYAETQSGQLKADIYLPKDGKRHPGVLVVHGGAWRMGTRAQLSGVAQKLAENGFATLAISYRLAPEYKFPAQIEDCKAAVRYMREHCEELRMDPEHIGAFGYSAGAQLVALLGTLDEESPSAQDTAAIPKPSTRLQAVVAGGAPCDFRIIPLDHKWLSFWLGGSRREVADQYRLASPAAFVSNDDPPMFFFHAENDELVPLMSPQAMCRLLNQVGVPAELYVVPQVGHIAAAMDRTAIDKSVAFLTKYLQMEQASP